MTITAVKDSQGQLPAFDVTFAARAYIPERTSDGDMFVDVQSGAFAFRA